MGVCPKQNVMEDLLISLQIFEAYKTPKQSKFDNYFLIYKDEERDINPLDNSSIIVSYGCDGANHAVSIDQVWYDENKQVTFAKNLTNQIVGRCDQSCGHKGFFSV